MNTKKEQWQFLVRNAPAGVAFLGARKNARGKWCRKGDDLPKHVQEFLCLKKNPSHKWGQWLMEGFESTQQLVENAQGDVTWQKVKSTTDAQGVFYVPEPPEVEAERIRLRRTKMLKGKKNVVWNLTDLASYVGASEDTEKSIQHRLYKDTDSGIGFSVDAGGKEVSVSGYCEGTDAECQTYALAFPFTTKEFDEMVSMADKDGSDLWDQTHGCEKCGPEDEFGNRPINPKCKECGGCGTIL